MRTLILLCFLSIFVQGCAQKGPVRLYPGSALANKAEATLLLPEAFEVIQVNHEGIPQSVFAFRTGTTDLRLAPGPNHIQVQYKSLWDISADEHQVLESGLIDFNVDLKANETYNIEWQKPKSFADAQDFADQPKVTIAQGKQTWLGLHQPKQSDLILISDKPGSTTESIALDKLEYWWQRANHSERSQFLKSIKKTQ